MKKELWPYLQAWYYNLVIRMTICIFSIGVKGELKVNKMHSECISGPFFGDHNKKKFEEEKIVLLETVLNLNPLNFFSC